ncbi:hypothetical protein V3C99_018535 [Haemonchus contortus]|uniref:CCHC-type domain-containing protein n=1 Tax=Haemonchus contortus TaxID=6289 RepID=A0A7I4Z089_HAECO
MCGTVIRKESVARKSFDVQEIIESIEEIITLQETTELTTRTFDQSMQGNSRSLQERYSNNRTIPGQSMRMGCLRGETHLPQWCDKLVSLEERRTEATRRRVCWRCFNKGHDSRQCLVVSKCPKCDEDHRSSLCTSNGSRSQPANTSRFRQYPALVASTQATPRSATSVNHNRSQQRARLRSQQKKVVEFEPSTITLLLDSEAQRNFVKSSLVPSLKLPSLSTTSFTTVWMGELRETFQSNEVRIT